jgi:IS5 family transposase
MLIDRYPKEDIFARVPKMTERIDPVLQQLDQLLDDDEVYHQVRNDFGKRHRYTLVHGRHATPVEVLLRLLLLKHLYGWSYQETEDRVDESLVLRWFCRLFWEPTPDDTTLIRWANTLQPETLHALNDRVVELARQAKVTQGRKLRLDATCVQTEIHHPTDSGLLVDSVRVRLPLRQARQRAGRRAGALAGANLSLAPALSQAGGTTVTSAVTAQGRRQRGGAKTAVPEARGDHRAHGAAGEPCGGGAGPADGAAGHATA